MKLKYIFLVLFGIIIFLILNNIDTFNISNQYKYIPPVDTPVSSDLIDATRDKVWNTIDEMREELGDLFNLIDDATDQIVFIPTPQLHVLDGNNGEGINLLILVDSYIIPEIPPLVDSILDPSNCCLRRHQVFDMNIYDLSFIEPCRRHPFVQECQLCDLRGEPISYIKNTEYDTIYNFLEVVVLVMCGLFNIQNHYISKYVLEIFGNNGKHAKYISSNVYSEHMNYTNCVMFVNFRIQGTDYTHNDIFLNILNTPSVRLFFFIRSLLLFDIDIQGNLKFNSLDDFKIVSFDVTNSLLWILPMLDMNNENRENKFQDYDRSRLKMFTDKYNGIHLTDLNYISVNIKNIYDTFILIFDRRMIDNFFRVLLHRLNYLRNIYNNTNPIRLRNYPSTIENILRVILGLPRLRISLFILSKKRQCSASI
jgi:hypothetical protein